MSSKPSPSSRSPGAAPDAGAALRSLIRAARGVFGRPLRIERAEGKLRVVLEPESVASNPDDGDAAGATAPGVQALLMAADLKAHLDRCSRARATLPHLATLEHELKQRGMQVFDELPLRVLQRASGQLDGLAQEPVLEGFALLQARLDLAIVAREERSQAQTTKRSGPSSFLMDHKLQVSEASMSDFMLAAGHAVPDLPAKPGQKPD